VRALIPASGRLDLHKVRAFLGTNNVQLASEETLAGAYPTSSWAPCRRSEGLAATA
jgi:hypothetical protein